MKIHFKTNIDFYKSDFFPELHIIPRKGEYVRVKKEIENFILQKGYFIELQVVNVTYYENDYILIELHFNENQAKIANLNKLL